MTGRKAVGCLGVPRSLAELGLEEAGLTVVAAQAAGQLYPNSREVTADGVPTLLRAAFGGGVPERS